MRAYRLVKAKYRREVLEGVGAAYRYGARWNARHDHAVYAADSRALAIIESLAHVPALTGLPPHVMCVIEIPEGLIERPSDAPDPADAAAAQAFGHRWFREQRSVALVVPSVIVPEESNVVMNGAHPEVGALEVVTVEEYPIDERLRELFGKR